MRFFDAISSFFSKYLFNTKWRCVNCDREIFGEDFFCEKCKNQLPYNDKSYCQHCGRKLKIAREYCTTCKGRLINVDKARSVYNYEKPISVLIQRLKYNNKRYLAEPFAQDMANVYYKNYFNADGVVFIPMTDKAFKKRGYNQSEELAKEFCKITGLELLYCLKKVKETSRQATLNRTERQKNLKTAFRVVDRKLVKGKKILIIDDVTTTGATSEVVAERLKRAKARAVFLISVASVPPKDGY